MKNKEGLTLRECMRPSERAALGKLPTTHQNCKEIIGVMRPGKTERDRRKRLMR